MKALIILGGGGHGVVAAEAAQLTQRWSEISFLDDNLTESPLKGIPLLGKSSLLSKATGSGIEIFVALGSNQRRLEFLNSIRADGGMIATIIHPSAVVSASSEVGSGTIVCAGAVISSRVIIGSGCIINHGSTIDHDCRIGDGVHVSPGANLAGSVNVQNRAWIGIGAAVREGMSIGCDVIVGAGAAVVTDIFDNQKVGGVPACELVRK